MFSVIYLKKLLCLRWAVIENSSIKGYIGLGASLPENGNREGFRNARFFQQLDDGQCPPPQKKIVSFNFGRAVLSFGFLDP